MAMFCNQSNLEKCLNLLKKEFKVLDYDFDLCGELNVSLVNVVYSLINDLKRLKVKVTTYSEENSKLNLNLESLSKEKTKLKRFIENHDENVFRLKDTITDLTSQKDALRKDLSETKVELNKVQKSLNVQKLHHEHESRRKEILIDSLKNKLDVYLDSDFEKAVATKVDMPIEPSLSDLRQLVTTLLNNLNFTVTENANVRTFVLNQYRKFRSIVNQKWPDAKLDDFSEAFLCYPSSDLLADMEEKYEIIHKLLLNS